MILATARRKLLGAGLLALSLVALSSWIGARTQPAPTPAARVDTPRVVSLNPSLTAILLAVDADAHLVGVDDYSARLEPRVRDLPRVGGLFNPGLESIVALQPGLVALVPSAQQRSLRERLEALGIAVLALPNLRTEELLASIEILSERVGRGDAGRARVAEIRAAWAAARQRHAGAPRKRGVLVIQRDPLYVVGGNSYLDDMLDAAGFENLAAGLDDAYPRVSIEWLIDAAPDWILDVADPHDGADEHWARWPSLPAVAGGRVRALDDSGLTIPGPWLDRALARLEGYLAETGR